MQNNNEYSREELEQEMQRRQAIKNEAIRRHLIPQEEQEQAPQGRFQQYLQEQLQDVANSPGMHAIQGAQVGLPSALTLGQYKPQERGEGIAYDIGKLLGKGVGYGLTGEAASLAPGLAALSPARALAGTGSTLAKGAEMFQPNKYAENILSDLVKSSRGGDNTNIPQEGLQGEPVNLEVSEKLPTSSEDIRKALSTNSREAAKDIQGLFNKHSEIDKANYERALNNNGISDHRFTQNIKSLIPKDVVKSFDHDIGDLYKEFTNESTIKNAHELQKQLGFSIRQLENTNAKSGLGPADQKVLQGYRKAQNLIKSTMSNELSKLGEEHGVDYIGPLNAANKYHFENIVPFKLNSKISQIAKGKINNPGNLTSIFKHPEEHITKIAEELGEPFKNKLIYGELGKIKGKMTNEKLHKAVEDLDKKGLSDYVSEELTNKFDKLERKTKTQNIVKGMAGGVGGAILGNLLPIPGGKEIGAIAGYAAAPAIEKLLASLMKNRGK
jgi:hypothetical protein